ncbi:phiSA1p31-related protein [Streptomyces chryseus]
MNDRDRFMFVDRDENPLVFLIDAHGDVEVHGDDRVCKLRAAAILRYVAAQFIAEHPRGACTPQPDAQGYRPGEPLHSHAGTLDRDRKVWTDGTGHAWNLSLPWGDVDDRAWLWGGVLDSRGAPLMRTDAEGDGEVQPLDVVRSLYGPIAPLSGGAA